MKLLCQANADVDWVEPENFHLTLKLLDEVTGAKLDDIKAALDAKPTRTLVG
ncbi:MAG: hypothetical protein NTY01_09370 [Verrucomicrobia bacterium]|nr:hypothetical protein [Verrucomicrobiota bacterium]